MNNVQFVHPNIFYIAVVVIFIISIIIIFRIKKRKKILVKSPFVNKLKIIQKKVGIIKSKKIFFWTQWIFFSLAVIFLIIALARPQKISEEHKITKNGVDILIALDVSESMLAEDLKPNRIESAKKYIENFVSGLKTDRVGLEVFAGKTFTQSPMSFDYNVVKYYLSEISTDSINQQIFGLNGTAIGDAIISAVNRFKNSPERTKIIILLTDGEANVGVDPVFAAEHARTNNIKVYTIGLGKKEGALMPIGAKNGKTIYARNRDGSLYKTKFDEKTLKDIANVSGGRYFWAGNNQSLKKSLKTIGDLEKKEYEAETVVKQKDLFWDWLFLGFLSAMISFSLMIYLQNLKGINFKEKINNYKNK